MATKEETQETRSALFDGYLDAVDDDGWIVGWASTTAPNVPARLIIKVDGVIVAETVADQFREDLAAADLPNSSCAFWHALPDHFADGLPHVVEVALAETDEPLRNSPQHFQIASVRARQREDDKNFVPNADFAKWPSGLAVNITKRMQEFCAGWYFDYRKDDLPDVTLSPITISDLSLKPAEYALKVTVTRANPGYMRIFVPIDATLEELAQRRFSICIRRPAHADAAALHVEEIFVASLLKSSLRRLWGIRKKLAPKGTQRVIDIASPRPDESMTLGEGAQPALVIQLSGEGELTLCSPSLIKSLTRPAEGSEVTGEFEDPNIQSQATKLKLSAIWGSRRLAVSPATERPAVPAHATGVQRGQAGIPFIQIVIPVFNAAPHVEEAIRSILECTDSAFEILLFDDGSEPHAADQIARWEALDPRVRYHTHGENIGYTRNINIALQSTISDYVVLLNSDTIVTPGWLARLYEGMLQSEDTAAVGPLSNAASWQSVPKTKTAAGEWSLNSYPGSYTPSRIASVIERVSDAAYPEFPLLNGFCTLLRRSALDAIGYYDDSLFPQGYGEENDLCLRLGKAGYKLRVADNCFVYHKKSLSFGSDRRKVLSKKASEAFRAKHPEVNINEIEEAMRINPAVNTVRERLVQAMQIEMH